METKKSRVFTRKVVALFLAILMAMSCFTGAMSAYAAIAHDSKESAKNYYDDNLAYNMLAWAEATDEQTAEALLDWADAHLSDLVTSLLGNDHLSFSIDVVGQHIGIDGYLDSIDGVIDILNQANTIVNKYKGLIGGNIGDINLGAINDINDPTTSQSSKYMVSKCKKSYRANYSAKTILIKIVKILYENAHDSSSSTENNVVGAFIKGQMSLGLAESFIGGNVYSLLKEPLGMWDGYQSNLVYNIVANLLITKTGWYTQEEQNTFLNDLKSSTRTNAWNFDRQLVKLLNEKLLQNISVLVNYPTYYSDGAGHRYNETSYTRKRDNKVQDPKLQYSNEYVDENGVPINVYLFRYGDEKLELKLEDSLFSFSFRALKFAWNTVLKDTLDTLHVNYNTYVGDDNFDNEYFYWAEEHLGWDYSNWKSNYAPEKVQAWAEAVYNNDQYQCKSAEAFLKKVKATLQLDRGVAADSTNKWQDIDSTMLFPKMRYNPLADLYFNIPTGPINLYFEQTGTKNIEAFFKNDYDRYTSIFDGLNNALVAIVDDFFPASDNVGYTKRDGSFVKVAHPTLSKTTTGATSATIASTLVSNVLKMVEYTGNATDADIFNPYYSSKSISEDTIIKSQTLAESNFEEAMLPFLVSCLQNITLIDQIHDEKWDSCSSFEAVGIVVLEEYLSNILPDKDYSGLWKTVNGKIVVNNVLDQDGDGDRDLLDVVLVMGRDAGSFWLQSLVPCRDKSGNAWDVYKRQVSDSTTIFDILNSILCYYASDEKFANDGITGKCAANVLGVIDLNTGKSKVNTSNSVWTNIDNIANKLLPIAGQLQYGKESDARKFNSKDLLWNDVIAGLFDISNTSMHSSGKAGITNVVQRFLTMASSDPIKNNNGKAGFNVMIYDVIADIVNSLLGKRYSSQKYENIVPNDVWYVNDGNNNTDPATPIDALLRSDTLAYFSNDGGKPDGYSQGVVGILAAHLYEFFSSDKNYAAGAQGTWNGAMFVVKAVNNFIPSFVPQLSEHKLAGTTAVIDDATQSGITDYIRPTSLNITNNSVGLNRAYKDKTGKIVQDGRYYILITDINNETDNDNDPSGYDYLSRFVYDDPVIAPGETLKLPLETEDDSLAPEEGSTYTFTVIYNIYQAKNVKSRADLDKLTPLYKDIETKAYMYITPENTWVDTLYKNDRAYVSKYTNIAAGGKSSDNLVYATAKGGSTNNMYATIPTNFIVPMSDISSIEDKTFLLRNNASNADTAYSMYSYLLKGTSYYSSATATAPTTASADNKNLAYAAIDNDGNILNYNLYDYVDPTTGLWKRGSVASSTAPAGGYTKAEIDNIIEGLSDAQKAEFRQRTHIAYTYDEAVKNNIVKGLIKEDGKVTGILVNPTTNFTAGGESKTAISFATSVPGIIFNSQTTSVAGNGTAYRQLFRVVDSGKVSGGNYPMGVMVYTASNQNITSATRTNMIVADDTVANSLRASYNEILSFASVYRPSDMQDVDPDTGTSSQTYDNLQNALASTIATLTTPLTVDVANQMTTQTERIANTEITNDRLHNDTAYVPVKSTVALPASLAKNAVAYNGYWYYDDEHTAPIYSNTALTDPSQDPNSVVELDEKGHYRHVNANSYETDWNYKRYPNAPFRYKTNVQAQNDNGLLYEKLNFTYYDNNGNAVSVADDDTSAWTYKVANVKVAAKPTTTTSDPRGLYQKASDNMSYNLEMLEKNIGQGVANTIGKGVIEDMANLDQMNYDIMLFGSMRKMGNEASKLVETNYIYVLKADNSVRVKISPASTTLKRIYVDAEGNQYESKDVERIVDPEKPYTTTHSSVEINTAKDLYDEYRERAMETRRVYAQNLALGSKLEAEVVCATGNPYGAFTVVEEPGKDIVVKTTATSVDYGKVENGELKNTEYSGESWKAYIQALANALYVINHGRAADPSINVTDIYAVKANLQRAENNLTVGEDVKSFTVSGTVVIAKDLTGTSYSGGIGGITVKAGDVSVETEADGTFEIEVPLGTDTLEIAGSTTIDRTVGVSGAVSGITIPVVVCDYNHDAKIEATDVAMFAARFSASDVYTDLNCDQKFDGTDKAMFGVFVNRTVSYGELNF